MDNLTAFPERELAELWRAILDGLGNVPSARIYDACIELLELTAYLHQIDRVSNTQSLPQIDAICKKMGTCAVRAATEKLAETVRQKPRALGQKR